MTLIWKFGWYSGQSDQQRVFDWEYISKFSILQWRYCCCSVAKLCPISCDPMNVARQSSLSLLYPWACSNSCPLSWWCHPAILSSVTPFCSCAESFPASWSFPMSQLFASGGQNIGASASASFFPMTIHSWFPLGWTGWISLLSSEGMKLDKLWCFSLHFIVESMYLCAQWSPLDHLVGSSRTLSPAPSLVIAWVTTAN